MKFIGFENKAVARAKLTRLADLVDRRGKELYWRNLQYQELQSGIFLVGFPDRYVTWLENNLPNVAAKLYDTWQEARDNPIGRVLPRVK